MSFNITDELLEHMRQIKMEIVQKFSSSVEELPPQGSKGWLKMRETVFGGSEVAVLLGLNPYSDLKKLVAGKVGLTHFSGNMATRWGNMFENITEILVKRLLPVERIWELSSLPGFCKGHRYSPDGLGVVRFRCTDSDEYLITLMEYKAPFSSIPKGEIPKHYVPQVKIGLCDLPFAETALFVSNSYRKCSVDDFKFNSAHDLKVHKPYDKVTPPIAAGVIVFTQSAEQKEAMVTEYSINARRGSDSDADSSDDDTPEFYEKILRRIYTGRRTDFGNLDGDDFNLVLKLYMSKMITAKFVDPLIFEEELDRIDFMPHQRDIPQRTKDSAKINTQRMADLLDETKRGVGRLPWKLFISDMIIQPRDDSFKALVQPKIEKGIEILEDIIKVDSRDERVKRLYMHFENKSHYIDRQIEQQ